MDEGFILHVDEQGVVASWVVTKPTVDGNVTRLNGCYATDKCVSGRRSWPAAWWTPPRAAAP